MHFIKLQWISHFSSKTNDFLLEEVIYRDESLIPSKMDEEQIMKGLTATERCFAWNIYITCWKQDS